MRVMTIEATQSTCIIGMQVIITLFGNTKNGNLDNRYGLIISHRMGWMVMFQNGEFMALVGDVTIDKTKSTWRRCSFGR